MRKAGKIWVLVVLTVVFVIGSGISAMGQEPPAKLAGTWQAAVTATSIPGSPTLTSIATFLPSGSVLESRRLYVPPPMGPAFESAGHGEWIRTAPREFEVKFVFLLQAANNSPLDGADMGTDNITLHLQLNDKDELTGTWESRVIDPQGNVLFAASGTYKAKRLQVRS